MSRYMTGKQRSQVMQLWHTGYDTATIAKLMCCREAIVANTLSHQREIEFAKKNRSAA